VRLFLLLITVTYYLWAPYSYAEPEAEAQQDESVFDLAEGDEVGVSSSDSVFSKIDSHALKQNESGLEGSGYYTSARVNAINKITAKSRQITIQLGKPAYFDNAEITLHKCWKSPGRPTPINQILVTVTENKFDEDPKQIFQGWLISSQPALSTLEHPVYEVIAAECVGKPEN
jgi:hypothetical protein